MVGLIVILAAGCAGTKKRFTIITEPPDAEIKVRIAKDEDPDTYRSPAKISIRIPAQGKRRYSAFLEIVKDQYKPKKLFLNEIKEDEVISLTLERIFRYRLSYRLTSPVPSDTLAFNDKVISVTFTPGDQAFQMALTNVAGSPIRILWDRAEFTDMFNRQRRLMHSGVRYEDRNNIIPPQTVPANGSVRQEVMTVDSIAYSREKKTYERKPLYTIEGDVADQLKGMAILLFLPVEFNRQIIPYNFRFEITEAIKE
jgi:hypothetical protein